MIKIYVFIIGIILISSNIHASTNELSQCGNDLNNGVVILNSSKSRFNNKKECFRKEHDLLEKYRSNHSSIKKQRQSALPQIVGLALSGGGIKSTAFQLGLLSGLHRSKNSKNAPLLKEIDYISSVSGGSWANGAYITALESDDKFFSCLSKIATSEKVSTACNELVNILANQQNKINGSKAWQKQIIDNFLREKDPTFKFIREEIYKNPIKPFPIFLSTHSNTIIGKKDPKNFPFEFTPYSISAIVDCNSPETPCGIFRRYLRPLHWNNAPEKGFVIDISQETSISTVVEKYKLYEPSNDLHISHAMWASGGLVAKVFSLHLHISKNNEKIPGVRDKYILSDGGKTDNVGLIPLVERGADLIILSQIASDTKLEFGDLNRSAKQIDRLFGLNVNLEKLIQPHIAKNDSTILTQSCIKDGKNNISSIWLIKPTTTNMTAFYAHLKNSRYSKIFNYLDKKEISSEKSIRFPQNATIKLGYPQELIYAYYALGEYIGQKELSNNLNDWIKNGSQCNK